MSTPNQPNDETQAGSRPEASEPTEVTQQQNPADFGGPAPANPAPPPGGQQSPGMFGEPPLPPLPVRETAQAETESAVPVPPWQRTPAGPTAPVQQQEPQSSLGRPGHSPVVGRSADAAAFQPAGTNVSPLPTVGTAAPARSVSDLAAKAARKEAAMVKSVGIDGPTRSIARPELSKDMPDLSELRHPLPAPAPEPVAATPANVYQNGPQQRVVMADPQVVAAATSGEPLRATVQIRRIDPWTALKVSLVISLALFLVWMIAVGMLYLVLGGMGVWDRLNSTFTDMVSESSSDGLITSGQVFWYAGLIGLANVVLMTALSTIGTFIYNQCSDLVGGIQVTLADPD